MGFSRRCLTLTTCISLGLAVGCTEEVDSEDIRTSGMYADFEAIAEGDGSTEVKLTLRVGGDDSNTFVRLTRDDELQVQVDGDARSVRRKEGVGNRVWYEASADTAADGTRVEVAFLRGDEDEDAPSSTTTLPAPFSIEGASDEVKRSEGVTLSWEPDSQTGLKTEWKLEGDCLFTETDDTTDGSLTLEPTAFDVTGDDDDVTCDATVTIERIARGSVDDAFGEGGRFDAIQRRSVRFRSVP